MTPLAGTAVLTAEQMRAAEAAVMAAGTDVHELMARAGAGVAAAVERLAAGAEVLVLCGPGNNGGDGYVAAARLREAGLPVRVAAFGTPATEAASRARAGWSGPVEAIGDAEPAPVLVDAVFGTGLSRPLDEDLVARLHALRDRADLAVAVDLPSGVSTNDGVLLSDIPAFDLTLALGAAKPAHLLQPAAARMGSVRVIDIGVRVAGEVTVIDRPRWPAPGPEDHKYSRGLVTVVSGPMHGASELAALSAYRAGAGYVLLLTGGLPQRPHAIVRKGWSADALADERIGAVVVGPGLGRDDRARAKLDAALATRHPLVIDGDALHLLDPAQLRGRAAPSVLTPHAGEFANLFGKSESEGSKLDRARAAARHSGAVVVFKGPDTVIAAPDGSAVIAAGGSPWLSVAGTGDVLAGAIGAMLARGLSPAEAAAAGVWLHGEAARLLDRCFLADELADALPAALRQCR